MVTQARAGTIWPLRRATALAMYQPGEQATGWLNISVRHLRGAINASGGVKIVE